MSVLPFLAVAILGAVIATLLRDIRRLGPLAGLGAVVVALAAASLINPDTPLSIGGGALAGSDHLRLVLTLCLAGGLLVLIVTRLATWQPSAPGALLGGAAGIGLALGLAGTPPGLLGAAAATIVASVLALGSPAAPSRIRALARELRGAATSLVIGLLAAGIVPGVAPALGAVPAEPAAAALVLLGMALVVAHRFGAIPLHARVSRLADAAPSGALPILAAWLPAAWGLVILGWAPAALGPSSAGLGLERGLVVALALATLLLGTVAALIQDEVEHVVAYTIVADAGVALLALAALDPAARDAARAWVLVFATTRTAMIGWTIAFRAAFGTGRLRDTTGWLLCFLVFFRASQQFPNGALDPSRWQPFSITIALIVLACLFFSSQVTKRRIPYLVQPAAAAPNFGPREWGRDVCAPCQIRSESDRTDTGYFVGAGMGSSITAGNGDG